MDDDIGLLSEAERRINETLVLLAAEHRAAQDRYSAATVQYRIEHRRYITADTALKADLEAIRQTKLRLRDGFGAMPGKLTA